MFILIILTFVSSLPIHNITHQLNLQISVDQVQKGNLTLGLFCNDAPNSCFNIAHSCLCLENQQADMKHLKLKDADKTLSCNSSEQKFTQITNDFLQFQLSNITKWSSEVNDYHTEFGALGQQRNIETGEVDTQFKIFLHRMEFDGPKSQWLVFGSILNENDKKLLKYLQWTGEQKEGIPMRNITIDQCFIFIKKSFSSKKEDL